MSEILTVAEVAAWLRISKRQVYELAKPRTLTGEIRKHPIPVLRIGASVRFRKCDIDRWLQQLVESNEQR
jgi:excisionase family DNA binding protein